MYTPPLTIISYCDPCSRCVPSLFDSLTEFMYNIEQYNRGLYIYFRTLQPFNSMSFLLSRLGILRYLEWAGKRKRGSLRAVGIGTWRKT